MTPTDRAGQANPKIEPCPICGKPGTLRSNPRHTFVRCEDPLCLFAPERLFADDAIAVWNRLAGLATALDAAEAREKREQAVIEAAKEYCAASVVYEQCGLQDIVAYGEITTRVYAADKALISALAALGGEL